ncbi:MULTISPECIES: hypothetical protein [Levilactobacillus]|uniref:hypothetical protein n=1 Tax=Levilactobacillus TaxID=2767886 RepID=UPI0037564D75
MNKFIVRTALTSVTALALFGGADLLTNGNGPLTQTVVAQAKTVSRSQFLSDVNAVQKAGLMSTDGVKEDLGISTIKAFLADPLAAYGDANPETPTISGTIESFENLNTPGYFRDQDAFDKDYSGVMYLYKHFKSRLTKNDQVALDTYKSDVDAVRNTSRDNDFKLNDFCENFESALGAYSETVTKVQPAAKANKVYSVKARKQGKYVVVTGKVTNNRLTKSALAKTKKLNRVKVTSYRGAKYLKISKNTFKIKLYAPKAKSVKANAGGLNGSKYAAITKTVKVAVR